MTVVGRYELLGEIGRGGMGRVYLARQLDLERTAALKRLEVDRDADAGSLQRFVREAKLAGSLQHPALVTVFDVFEDGGAHYIGMEYMQAGSLRPWVGRLSHQQIGGVLEALLAGLGEAHRAGIVHRDLKPENLLLGREGRVRIADFGIAKAIDGADKITATGTVVGTAIYMAPEQATGAPTSPASDLYAVGVIAYELLAGEPPFRGGSPISILMRHQQEPPPPLTSRVPGVPDALAEWVHRLLEKDPADRFASAEQAWHALEDVLIDIAGSRWRRDAPITEAPSPPPPDSRSAPAPDTPTATDTRLGRPRVAPVAETGNLSIVVAEDDLLIREGIVGVLRSAGMHVVGQATGLDGLVALVDRTRPDVVVTDIRMPPTHTDEGLQAARRIAERHPSIGVVVLSQHLETHYAMTLLSEVPEGVAYLLKERITDRALLADAVRRTAAGECLVDPTIVARLMGRPRRDDPFARLTPREREVLALMAEGRSNVSIAEELAVAPRTVEAHTAQIFEKLGLSSEPGAHRRVLAVLRFLRSM